MIVIEPSNLKFLTHFQIMIRAGSLLDPEDRQGLSHFTARALLRGTRKKSFQALSLAIEILGGSISVHVDQSETMLRASVLTQNLDAFLDLLQEILTEPAFEASEMESLRKILEGEIEQVLQDPRSLVSRALLQTTYEGTGLARPVEGTLSGVESIDQADIRKFFESFYVRANLLFGVTSAIAESELLKKIELRLASMKQGVKSELKISSSPFFERKVREAVLVAREDMSTVPLFVASPGVSDAEPDLMALEVGNFVFGDDFTARLMQVLRNKNGWTYGAYSGFSQILGPKREAGIFSIYLFPSAEFVALALPKTVELLEEYAEKGLNAQEFAFAKEALHNRYPFRVDSPEKRLTLRLREIATGRKFLQPADYRKELSLLERSQVNDTIAKRVRTESLIISAAGDEAALNPVLSGLSGVSKVKLIEL